MEPTYSSETSVDFNGLRGVMSKKIELFIHFMFWNPVYYNLHVSAEVFTMYTYYEYFVK
jgi:hypothetical protein